jgi:glycosyltransferase involved in cell wall biosynthesis
MKVAMLTTVGERCGIAAYTAALVEALRRMPGVDVEVTPIRPGMQPASHYVKQARRLNSPDVDVVHIQHEYSFWGGFRPRRSSYWYLRSLIRKPVVQTAHSPLPVRRLLCVDWEKRPHHRLAKKLLLRSRAYRESIEFAPFATHVTVVHTEAARFESIGRGVDPSRIMVVPPGVPAPSHADADGRAFRRWYDLDGKRVVSIFGYVTPNKGYELTLKVLPSLPRDIVLVVAGGARLPDEELYVQALRHRVAEANLQGRVHITGYLSERQVAEAMRGSDLVLVPHTEATGSYSVTIPLSYGRPILASDLPCFSETASRLDCLELFEAGNEADYRRKLLRLLGDAARREELASGALKYASQFGWPWVAARTVEVYEKAVCAYREGGQPHGARAGSVTASAGGWRRQYGRG